MAHDLAEFGLLGAVTWAKARLKAGSMATITIIRKQNRTIEKINDGASLFFISVEYDIESIIKIIRL